MLASLANNSTSLSDDDKLSKTRDDLNRAYGGCD